MCPQSTCILLKRMHSHIGCICLTFLQCAFLNVSSNCLSDKMQSYIGCICLTFLPCSFLAVPRQLYRWPCHSLPTSLPHYTPLLKNTCDLETFDQSDWGDIDKDIDIDIDMLSEQWAENFQIFGKFSDFWKIFRFLENFQIFGKVLDFWNSFRFLENFQNFGKFSDIWKIFRYLKIFQTFGKCSDFWIFSCPQKAL